MAKIHGNNATLSIDGNPTQEADLTSLTLEWTGDVAEALAMADTWKTHAAGAQGWSLSGDFLFDDAAGHVMASLFEQCLALVVPIIVKPAGNTPGDGVYMYTGTALLTAFSISAPVAGYVTASFSMVGVSDLQRALVT